MPLLIAPSIEEKLSKKQPPVTRREVEQCFENRQYGLLKDTREKHRTNPPTLWFIEHTNSNRRLKIIFIQKGEDVILKSAFDPNEDEINIYFKYAT
jgi:hypothetical protein